MGYFLIAKVFLKHLIEYFIQAIHKSNERKKGQVISYEVSLLTWHFKLNSNTFENYLDI